MEMEDILKGMSDTFARMYSETKKNKPQPSEDSSNELEELKLENKQLRELAQKVIDGFDKVNTQLRDVTKERDELKNKVGSVKVIDDDRKKYYNEATSLRKKEAAYAKALGAIHGALEALASELK